MASKIAKKLKSANYAKVGNYLCAGMTGPVGLMCMIDPNKFLEPFGVTGLDAVARHMTALFGMIQVCLACFYLASCRNIDALGWNVAGANLRRFNLQLTLVIMPFGVLFNFVYPFKQPMPEPPFELPYPLILVQVGLGLLVGENRKSAGAATTPMKAMKAMKKG